MLSEPLSTRVFQYLKVIQNFRSEVFRDMSKVNRWIHRRIFVYWENDKVML